ncbi:MAG: ABC transporter permease, partial [Mangrovimonas sp.]|nr:ABC transporter permease [Mangrovimonas sp.]
MNFSLYIAKRYLRSKSSNNAINFITYIAILGIVLGSASLFIVLSGFSGLKDFTLQFSSLIDPDLKALPTEGKTFTLSEEQISQLKNTEEIAHFSKILQEQVIVTFDGKNYPATLKAVDENYESVTSIDNAVSPGNWFEQNTNEMVAGWGVSVNLSFGVLDYGKRVSLSVPKPGKGQVSSLKG